MANLVVVVDDSFPTDDNNVEVSYRWFAQGLNDSASVNIPIAPSPSNMNSSIVSDAITKANAAGANIQGGDRKLVLGGFS